MLPEFESKLPKDINVDFHLPYTQKLGWWGASLQSHWILMPSQIMFLKHDEYTAAELPPGLIIDTVLCTTWCESVLSVLFFSSSYVEECFCCCSVSCQHFKTPKNINVSYETLKKYMSDFVMQRSCKCVGVLFMWKPQSLRYFVVTKKKISVYR